MNKKIIATSLIFCCAAIFVSAQEIVIERASAIASGNKTTLAINYSGSGRIQFFAVHDEGSLTVDFPGVVSNFDFSMLEFSQVRAIEQVPLDPDSNRGFSVKFTLAEHVDYRFFDGEEGSVILLFQTEEAELETSTLSTQVEESSSLIEEEVTEGEEASMVAQSVSHVLNGKGDSSFLKSVQISQQGSNVQILATTQGIKSYKYFYLTEPDRYVIDLYGIVCQLDRDHLEFSDAKVKNLRIKQFQVHPVPITRLVLDLDEPLEILLSDNADGIITLSAGMAIEQAVSLAEASVSPVQETVQEPVRETDIAEELAPVQVVESAEVVLETPQVTVASDEDEIVETVIAVVAEPNVVSGNVVTEAVVSNQVVEDNEIQATPEALEEAVQRDDPIVQTIEPDPIPHVEIEAVTQPKEIIVENEPAAPKAKHQLPFMVANEVDKELDSFIKTEKTFYTEMKDAKPLKPKAENLVVTNYSIQSSLNHLTESNAMQSDAEVKSEFENSSLFEEYSSDFSDDRIAGGEQKYKGFEIQGIDVVDVNVTDLLRFFADQVGFNLYVDPTVKSLKATYKFANIPWDQAMDIILRNAGLDYQYNNGVLRVATTKKFKDEAVARRELIIEQELSVPPETVTFRLSYAKASEIAPIVSEYLSPRGSLLQDERTNILIIEDIPKKMLAIRSLIRKLDTQIPQVTIESRIVETTKRFMRELGIQWGLSGIYAPEYGTQTGMTFPNRVTVGGPTIGNNRGSNIEGGYAVSFPVIDESPAGIGFSLGNILDTFKLDISLQMLESEGLGQIISAPKITTQNNRTAIIQNGQRIPIQTVQRGTITVRYVNAVLELEVTPHITSEKTIIMDLIIDKSEPDYTRDVLGNPIINIRRAETRVLVKDGGTAVIGGIYVLNEQNSSRGVPGLKKVPFINRLFGSERKTIENQELLIFVTPRIVKY